MEMVSVKSRKMKLNLETTLINKLVKLKYIKRGGYSRLTFTTDYVIISDEFSKLLKHNGRYFKYAGSMLLPIDNKFVIWRWTMYNSKLYNDRLHNLEMYIETKALEDTLVNVDDILL